jgi:hypothetical protein
VCHDPPSEEPSDPRRSLFRMSWIQVVLGIAVVVVLLNVVVVISLVHYGSPTDEDELR